MGGCNWCSVPPPPCRIYCQRILGGASSSSGVCAAAAALAPSKISPGLGRRFALARGAGLQRRLFGCGLSPGLRASRSTAAAAELAACERAFARPLAVRSVTPKRRGCGPRSVAAPFPRGRIRRALFPLHLCRRFRSAHNDNNNCRHRHCVRVVYILFARLVCVMTTGRRVICRRVVGGWRLAG